MRLSQIPFHIGPQPLPTNPESIPNLLDMDLRVDPETDLLVQVPNKELRSILDEAYKLGGLIGTPIGGKECGLPYAEDFRTFIHENSASTGRLALEIGAGAGYLSDLLIGDGWDLSALEPGEGYKTHWAELGLQVVQDFFPSPHLTGPFDLIVCFAVLEHIEDLPGFFDAIKSHLTESGVFIFAVPDCEDEISIGDPAILLHEHYSYFTEYSLKATLQKNGLSGVVSKSKFGRSLYGAVRESETKSGRLADATGMSENYLQRMPRFIANVTNFLSDASAKGELGIFAAGRGLNFLDPNLVFRFFDDNSAWTGLYLPPFSCPIENRSSLLLQPVDDVLILSRTFGETILSSLRTEGYRGAITLLSELDSSNP